MKYWITQEVMQWLRIGNVNENGYLTDDQYFLMVLGQ